MFDSESVMKYVDKLRSSKDINILELNKGIKSARNYNRYLNGEFPVPFDTFLEYLSRMNVPIQDFVAFVYSDIEQNNLPNFYFIENVLNNNFKKADELFDYAKEHTEDLAIENLMLNSAIQKYRFILGKLPKNQYIDSLKKHLDFKKLKKCKLITREEIDLMSLLLEVDNPTLHKEIIAIFNRVIYTEDLKILSWKYSYSELKVIIAVLNDMVEEQGVCVCRTEEIDDLIDRAFEILRCDQTNDLFMELNQCLIKYFNFINDKERYDKMLFYHYTYLMSKEDYENFDDSITEEMKNVFLANISNLELLNKSFYKEMNIKDGTE